MREGEAPAEPRAGGQLSSVFVAVYDLFAGGPKIAPVERLKQDGGRTEVLGGFLYANFGKRTDVPALRIIDSTASFAGLRQTSLNPAWYGKFVEETRGGETRVSRRSQSRSIELFVGRPR